jgi:hypothetical protein
VLAVTRDGTVLPRAGASAAERATHAFPLVERWLLSESMDRLLRECGHALPGSGGRWDSPTDAHSWLHLSEELPGWLQRVLVDGSQIAGLTPEHGEILRRTLAVERMAAVEFNFRTRDGKQYRERSQAVRGDFTAESRARIERLADSLGLVNPRPTRYRRYDKTLVMGGGYRSPLLRARYARQLADGGIDLGELTFLGSSRALIEEPPERPAAESYAPGARDEFDLMIGAAGDAFGTRPAGVQFLCGCPSARDVCPVWPCRDAPEAGATPPAYTHERQADLLDEAGRPVGAVLSASTGRPPYRPDTSDTFALWARRRQPRPDQRVLVVTTQVFVPFQMFDGIRQLHIPYGVQVDTVGFGAEWGDRPQTAEYLLQETLSGIRSARRLLVAAAETLARSGVGAKEWSAPQ